MCACVRERESVCACERDRASECVCNCVAQKSRCPYLVLHSISSAAVNAGSE